MRERVGLKAQTTGFATNLRMRDERGELCHKKAQKAQREMSLCLCAFVVKFALEIQLQPKLELPRVEGGGWATVVAAVVGALVECPHVVDEW
jgi:hypothetical protein